MKNNRFFLLLLVLSMTLSVSAAIPVGYYHEAVGKRKAELKTALNSICQHTEMVHFGSGDGSTWEAFYLLDRRSDGSVRDIYSNIVRNFDSDYPVNSVSGMHIEHALPRTWFTSYDSKIINDLHHLFPVDGTTNVTKSYYPLGVVGIPTFDNGVSKVGPSATTGYTGTCFEPADQYKGDIARAYLYISTMYEDMASEWQGGMMDKNTYPVWRPWALSLLLQWNQLDPVSTEERERNDAIFALQGNRNPFVDYPDLADYIWGADTVNIYPFPTETRAYLYAPHSQDKVSINTITGNSTSRSISIGGENLSGNVLLDLTNGLNSGFGLSTSSISAVEVMNDCTITISFTTITAGSFFDTLLIHQGGLSDTLRIPLSADVADEFMINKWDNIGSDCGTIYWTEKIGASEYLVDIYAGDTIGGDLFMYYYSCDGAQNNAIGLYNATADTIDLSKYELRMQRNGVGEMGYAVALQGELAPRETYVLVNGSATDAVLTANADSLVYGNTTSLTFSGNDAIGLYRSGVLIDIVGVKNDSRIWGAPVTMIRVEEINTPQAEFRWDEWQVMAFNSSATLNQHDTYHNGYVGYEYYHVSVLDTKYDIRNLHPNSYFSCAVYAVVGSDTIKAGNVMQIRTSPLAIPYAQDATHITSNSFYANWDEAQGAMSYLLTIFTMTEAGKTTEIEGFDTVLAVGRPLPEGWNSNCYGTYQDSASVGIAAPAMKLSEENDFIQSKNYSAPVEQLTFTYRFPQAALESQILLEGGLNNKFDRLDTIYCTNTNLDSLTYSFSADKGYRSFRWSFMKKNGNGSFALDDVKAKFAYSDTTFILRDRETTVTNFNVMNVTEGTTYYYFVKAFYCHLASGSSNVIAVTPTAVVGEKEIPMTRVEFFTQPDGIVLYNMEYNSRIRVFSTSGICLWSGLSNGSECYIPATEHQIYLIQIFDSTGVSVLKVVK